MNRAAVALALLATPGLVLVAFTSSTDVVPFGVAPALAGLGGIAAMAGAATTRPRVHGAGVFVSILGASLTGVSLGTGALVLGVVSAALMVASLNLHLVLPREGSGLTLVVTALVAASVVGGLGLVLGRLAGAIGGGGVDALGGTTAWIVLLVAVSWGLARRVQEARPG